MANNDSYVEVTKKTWTGGIKNAVAGVGIGLILVIGSVAALFWNEGRAVTTARSLAEGRGLVQSVDAARIDAVHDNGLVHLSGQLVIPEDLTDEEFDFTANAVQLVRKVEMYQWRETKETSTRKSADGGEETVTTYSYDRVWNDDRIDSSTFKKAAEHENPSKLIESLTVSAPTGTIGAFTVDRNTLDKLTASEKLPFPSESVADLEDWLALDKPITVLDGVLRVGDNPSKPVIGDLRITFETVPPSVISVIGRQTGSNIAPYQTAAGDQLMMVDAGTVPPEIMFANAEAENALITWLIRGFGLLFLFIGFRLLMGPVDALVSVIPVFGSLVSLGTGLLAFALTALIGPTTIAIAWIWYRPVLAIGILLVGAAVSAGVWAMGRRKLAAAAPA